ncbi:ABC transporter ATP-binding protein [Streptomyces sp. PTM05]|uniref:ABC transporter ATP-binding protein n=1 Tax=Streptantibioticus parmotrematis TaxID=2873249 RepID=A0ABS7QRJ9_9ACTN|nr:ABC transporter ATP-binding protein [Streptantibioticus parmotrematis]MBY8885817.1 ABC transporter ATP-binding protein [Streptantibioticus parmotrematis]
MLETEGLVKRYGTATALDGFGLTVAPGEVAGLIGHNGAGKTTFVEVVAGLARPDAGRVVIGGTDARRAPREARRLLGVAPQELALYGNATVRENLRLFGALAGLRRTALARAVDRVAEELRLTDVLDRPAGLLSGGQRRRTQAGTALVGEPALLLLDEPTAGADPDTRAALLAAVRARAAAGAAVVYTTHYLPELDELGATLAVARGGRIIARGTRRELLDGLPGEVRMSPGESTDLLRLPPAVRARACREAGELRVTSADPPAVLAAGYAPTSVDVRRPGLDDLYRSLASREANADTEGGRHAAA